MPKPDPKGNIHILVIGLLIGALFFAMLAYFIWLETAGREAVIERPENNRYDIADSKVIRGDILTADGAVIARTDAGETQASDVRAYPYGLLFTPVTGYMTCGRTGLEAYAHRLLMTSDIDLDRLKNEVLNIRSKGYDAVTTIRSDLQYLCWNLLQGYSGSITVMDPKTGAILAMVSNPTFDANTVAEDWTWLISDENTSGQLLNRSTQGLYAPGSTFKLITAIEFMREYPDTYRDFRYTCTGSCTADGHEISCDSHYAHGEMDLRHAVAYSCNCAFVEISKLIDPEKYAALCGELGFGQVICTELPSSVSSVRISKEMSEYELAVTAFGQGETMETPLQTLLITSMIANGGTMMKPYLLDHTLDRDGKPGNVYRAGAFGTYLSPSEAAYLKESMIAVVNEGTTPEAQSPYVQTAGKSGSAQVESDLEHMHAWFTGFAPADDPEIAVTVMLENAGHGSMTAAPLFKEIVDYWFSG